MRIRTIKPEFWSHPVMAHQTDHAQLIAIGLLNYADDHGYFYADPKLIRSALRPFDDDSSNVRRSLDDLSRIGYIELRDHQTHGKLGRVVSFADHQRVDRPKDSIIKGLYDSTNDRRTFVDASSLEWKGREQGTGKGKEGERAVSASVAIGEVLSLEAQVIDPAPAARNPDKSPAQLRAEKLHNKRESTPWDHAEVAAWRSAKAVVESTTEEEWQLLEWFYSLPQSETFARKALAQTLNNWAGELTKAKAHKARGSSAPGRKPATPIFR